VVQKLERLLEDAEGGLEENGDRVGVMDEHLKNVQTELTYTQVRPTPVLLIGVLLALHHRILPCTYCALMYWYFWKNQLHSSDGQARLPVAKTPDCSHQGSL
jgi:hypothetical protein